MTYTLDHLMLFSAEVYWRMLFHYFAQYSWLAVAINLAFMAAMLLGKGQCRVRLLFTLITLCWAWLGWRFYIIEYASINWFALYAGAACLLLLPVFLALSVKLSSENLPRETALLALTLGYIVIVRPLIMGVSTGYWHVTGLGLLPMPTVLMTFGVLLSFRFSYRWLVLMIPLLLLLMETLTLYQLHSPRWQEVPAVILLMVMVAASSRYGRLTGVSRKYMRSKV